MAKQILIIVEDQGLVANLLHKRLVQKGYDVDVVERSQAMDHLARHLPSVVLLDGIAAQPELTGLCLSLRHITSAPMIVLCDTPMNVDKLDSVECLTKPLDFRHLFAVVDNCVNSQRKRRPRPPRYLQAGNLGLDLQTHILTRGDHQWHLTPKEFLLMSMFMRNSGRVLTHKAIMKEVWSTDFIEDKRTLQVHVSWLRRKIEENPTRPHHLRTVRGVGYRFDTES